MNVSVLIPTRNRCSTLERTLEKLARQRLDGLETEVVVVDNGSEDGTAQRVRSLADVFPAPLLLVVESKRGASPARNAGCAAARGDVLLLLGDDTLPADDRFIIGHARLHQRRPERTYAVLGHIAWAPDIEVTALMRWLERGAQFDYGSIRPGPVPREYLYTSNCSVKREALERVGGFDGRIPFHFEDLELAARLFDDGLELDYHPELLVHHHHPRTLASWHERQIAAGRSACIANAVRGHGGPLVSRPIGLKWRAAETAGELLASVKIEWTRLPGPLRSLLYGAIHYGAYARGYREAERASGGNAPDFPAPP